MPTWEDRVDQFEAHPYRTGAKWVAGLLVAVGVVVAVLWGTGVVTAPWKGAGDGYRAKYNVNNWIAAQRGFHQEANDVTAFQAKIATAKADIAAYEKTHPSLGNGTPYDPAAQQDTNLHTTLSGLQQQCQNTVAAYNTDAQSYLTADWRDAGLPTQLDPALCS